MDSFIHRRLDCFGRLNQKTVKIPTIAYVTLKKFSEKCESTDKSFFSLILWRLKFLKNSSLV